jgi:glycogen(starch) synthase
MLLTDFADLARMLRMRICLYTDTALPKMGGQEMVVDALARQFAALGHEPTVFAPMPKHLSLCDETYPYKIVRHPRFFSTQYCIGWYRWFLWRHYRRRPFDVLHCHGIYPTTYIAWLLRERLPVPVVVTSHGGDVYENNVRLRKSVIRTRCEESLRSTSAIVAISRFTREGFTRLCPEAAGRIVDIPNGVDLTGFAKPSTAPPEWDDMLRPGTYAVFLGRLKHQKGVDVLLRALALVPPSGGVQLVIAGDGEKRAALEALCRHLGLQGRVRFVGTTVGPAKMYLLQNARFGVIPSRQWEAFGLVVLEGYAAGVPMIATNMAGLADLVQPEQTGLLVPPESPEHLAAAMQRLFRSDAEVARMSAAARQAVARYDWPSIAQRHLALYENLLAARRNDQRLAA